MFESHDSSRRIASKSYRRNSVPLAFLGGLFSPSKYRAFSPHTILTQRMADELNFSGLKLRITLQRQMQI